ncbi:MAG TPA: dCMP deaminase family protein [Thermotogota bacterium]|nr:dCMP deaminase family protein [Thermotogota bacterium]HRW91786.1 dCMP deaminase family protein [Thermotogota bacterium]
MDQFKKLVDKYASLAYSFPQEVSSSPSRPSFDQMYMAIAQIVSLRSTCLRGRVGAVITKDTRIVSIGYNGAPASLGQCNEFGCITDLERGGCIRTIHAEQNAIAYASRVGIPLEGGTMYVTMSPCIDCAKLILASGLSRVLFFEEYRNSYALDYLEVSGVQVSQVGFGLQQIFETFWNVPPKP